MQPINSANIKIPTAIAVERSVKLPQETKDIGEVLSAAHSEEKAFNRQQLLTILRNIRVLARHGLPIRSHDSEQSNFFQLLKLHGESDPSILKWLKKKQNMNISLSKCRGQCYDGASNMSGAKKGVAANIASKEPRAVYTHCYGHALNLAVGDTVKRSKVMRDSLDTVFEMSKLIKDSPRRHTILDQLRREMAPDKPGFRVLCSTRWTVRAASLNGVLENYTVLTSLWEISYECSKDYKTRSWIIGVKTQMHFVFLFGVSL